MLRGLGVFSANSLFTGLGAVLQLLASLSLVELYELEAIGSFGLIVAWSGLLAAVAHAKLPTLALTAATDAAADSLLRTGLLLSGLVVAGVSLALLAAAYAIGVPAFGPLELAALATLPLALAWQHAGVARLQRCGRLTHLGLARLAKGFVLLAVLVYLRHGEAPALCIAYACGHAVVAAFGLAGLRPLGALSPLRGVAASAGSLSGASLALNVSEAARQSLLASWLPPPVYGAYVYLRRLGEGAQSWPGQVTADRLIAGLSGRVIRFDWIGLRALVRRHALPVSVTAAGAVAAGAAFLWLRGRAIPGGWWLVLAVSLEVWLLFAVSYRRMLPVFLGLADRQWRLELPLAALVVALYAAAAALSEFRVGILLTLQLGAGVLGLIAYRRLLSCTRATPASRTVPVATE